MPGRALLRGYTSGIRILKVSRRCFNAEGFTMSKVLVLLLACWLAACTGIPDNVKAVQGFEAQAYLGKWYEIARLENWFETGLDKISAEYSLPVCAC
jgi:lipocalin